MDACILYDLSLCSIHSFSFMDVQIVYNKTGQRRESGFGITSTLEEAEKAAEMLYWVIFFTYSESYKSVCYLCFLPMVWKLKLHFQPLPFVHSC
jgi:hypothetical protein